VQLCHRECSSKLWERVVWPTSKRFHCVKNEGARSMSENSVKVDLTGFSANGNVPSRSVREAAG
jgi:hypothetical protein